MWDPTNEGIQVQELVLPTGKVVAQFLRNKRNGAKLTEILSYVRNKFRDAHPSQVNHNVASSLDAATTWGFLERRGSRFVEPGKKGGKQANTENVQGTRSPPSERCRRRRRRSRRRRRYRRIKRRRCCCRKGKRRYRRRR